MSLNGIASHASLGQLVHRTTARMASTVTGRSGRVYVQGEELQRHREDPKLSVFKAESGNESFVFKRVRAPFYDLSLRLADEFAGSRRLRMHTDCSPEEGGAELHYEERKKILRRVAEALQELHGRDWIHIDVKPDNILVNWTCDEGGGNTVTDVALGDFDIAFRSRDGQPRQTPHAIGNAIWRSPEGQTGHATKASDMFSLGLVCIYALGGGELLLLNEHQEMVKRGISPEQEILVRHFSYFGPVPEGLLQQARNEYWRNALKAASMMAEDAVGEHPELRFEEWGKELGREAQSMIAGLTDPDPTARLTIEVVLAHPWWQETA